MKQPFTIGSRIKSFKYAFEGIFLLLKTQHNAWIHFISTIAVVLTGLLFKLSTTEWCLIILSIIIVWMSEALNTACEFLADVTSPEFHPLIKKSKDVAAGAVLITAIGAVVIGLLIFLPKL
jgi:diacylglycerol kinase